MSRFVVLGDMVCVSSVCFLIRKPDFSAWLARVLFTRNEVGFSWMKKPGCGGALFFCFLFEYANQAAQRKSIYLAVTVSNRRYRLLLDHRQLFEFPVEFNKMTLPEAEIKTTFTRIIWGKSKGYTIFSMVQGGIALVYTFY
ncbi:hypothetical protein [Pseudophaeobacter flagellatus]|uniref:hypothetical protein n=1 Tax=Pseudophaeobacter flagellatus TaxID=2899119 RepID=UPI001E2ADF3F|nr:hypothetical protein [Pseudophaeobacter flagellatus]MCD9148531.1 hypothetical protein [Pseudophaeobacter flagellatus]